MTGSTWEDRMAARAAERAHQAAAQDAASDPHAGHHAHLRGTMVECSCGERFGVTTVAIPFFDSPGEAQAFLDQLSCHLCGERGVAALPGSDGSIR